MRRRERAYIILNGLNGSVNPDAVGADEGEAAGLRGLVVKTYMSLKTM